MRKMDFNITIGLDNVLKYIYIFIIIIDYFFIKGIISLNKQFRLFIRYYLL